MVQLLDEAINKVKNLPEFEQERIALLIMQEISEETPLKNINSQQEREQLINSLQGKYAHASTSSEDFARQKQAEIDWEDRNQ
jgi:hypothetical protein